MKLEQTQNLSQKLVLTQVMRQSLDCLQLSAPELTKYVQEAALSNPLLDVQMPTYYETELPSEGVLPEREAIALRSAEEASDISAHLAREKTFHDYMNEQIGQMKLVDDELLRLCRFLIDCLDERGYLDCPLEELSREFDIPLFSLEQALYAVQMLSVRLRAFPDIATGAEPHVRPADTGYRPRRACATGKARLHRPCRVAGCKLR